MQLPDIINGLFETLASISILNHCRVVRNSGQAHGSSLLSTMFFMVWGMWNIWYYPQLGQVFSFWAGIAVLGANLFWVCTIWNIRRHEVK